MAVISSLDVLLHEFGEDFVFALELFFEEGDLAFLGVLLGFGLAIVVEGVVAVFEEFLLPAIEDSGVQTELIAEVGDRCFLKEIRVQDFVAVLGKERRFDTARNRGPAVEEEDFHGVILSAVVGAVLAIPEHPKLGQSIQPDAAGKLPLQ